MEHLTGRRRRVVVVGAGTRFLSAMSYYTLRVTNALAERADVMAIPMRQLIPTLLYPGRRRVGAVTTRVTYRPDVEVMDGIDWYWVPNLGHDLRRLARWRPEVVIFEWWTGSVLHTYLVLALLAKALGATVIVEVHEVLDSSEDQMRLARTWVRALGRPFFRLAAGFVVHAEADRAGIDDRYGLHGRPCVVIQHGPFDQHALGDPAERARARREREAPPDAINLLYFGIIRPYKGVEDLLRAFDLLAADEVNGFWLTIVGEIWEGADRLTGLMRSSPNNARITLVDRFVGDDEVAASFASADAVVLPYRRSSASGPAHTAMSNGLPLVTTSVGGLPEAVRGYAGAVLVPPNNASALRDAIRRLPAMTGQSYADPHSWDRTASQFEEFMDRLDHVREVPRSRSGESGRLRPSPKRT